MSAPEILKELEGGALLDPVPGHTRQDHAVAWFVGTIAVGRVDINELIARAGVVSAEVEKGWAAKAVSEFPITPTPGCAVIAGPGQLGIGGVTRPKIQHALDAEQSAGFAALLASALKDLVFEKLAIFVHDPKRG